MRNAMCGICGYVNLDKRPVSDDNILRKMTSALIHRGPDDEGFFIKDNVALGHRRLSIIDLEKGHQPICDETSPLCIVYNGEVYNFPELKTELINKGNVFSTHSDTEVVLKCYRQWGPDCLNRFNGMFALAIWDGRDKTLFLARDRFGKKPLYFGTFGRTFIFGSELKSVFSHPEVIMDVDRMSLGKYFAYDYIPSPRTIIKGIAKLEPGHWLVLKNGEVKKKRYWDFRFEIDGSKKTDLAVTKKMLLETLRESVRKRLISDVPLGVFLSGGIDSSAVVAMMAGLMDPQDIKTFSIGFKERSYNEAPSASLIARKFRTDHHEKILSAEMMLDALPGIIDIIDEPFADSSIIPTYMVSQFTRETVKVALGGDGGDELFMGYPSFIAHRIAALYDRAPSAAKRAVRLFSNRVPGKAHYMSLNFKLKRFLKGASFSEAERHQIWIGSFYPPEQRLLFRDASDEALFDPHNIYDESSAYFNRYPGISNMDKVEYLYIKTYLPDDILTKVDRASMAVSLEVRAPFLDKEIADFAAAIPNSLKMRGFRTKHILKEALRGIVPNATIDKPKHGFAAPVGAWFRKELKELLLDTFRKDVIEKDGLFNYEYIDSLFKDHFSGRAEYGRNIWSLFIYQMWYNKWIRI
ncbi:MAG: asparagine synthase (glutamine-hydrolyzing) [Candidatus Omnitrophota bacterium]|nr:asparagine synthase (glutamine-hydrolyzing) [Candidatus Omnitrophota bacterium]